MKLKIFKEIVSYYDGLSDDHNLTHITTVLKNVMAITNTALNNGAGIDLKAIQLGALYHDTGLHNGREEHHIKSGEIVRKSKILRENLSDELIEKVAVICEEHRSSMKSDCTTLESSIVNDEDSYDPTENRIKRCMRASSGYESTFNHLRDKYGRNGYGIKNRTEYTSMTFGTKEKEMELFENEEEFRKLYNMYKMEEIC